MFDKFKEYQDMIKINDNEKTLILDYQFATAFSKLPGRVKKRAKLLRRMIFNESGLRKISQMESTVEFCFGDKKQYEKIRFILANKTDWSIERSEISPDISLTPWHYQKKNIEIRKKAKTPCPLSSLIEYRCSDDFGFEIAQKKFPFKKPLTDKKRLDNIETLKEKILLETGEVKKPLDMTLKELIEVSNIVSIPDKHDEIFNKKLKVLFDSDKKEFDNFLRKAFCIIDYIPDMRLRNLVDISKDSLEMDFTDFIEKKKIEHYRKCIEYVHAYYAKRKIEEKLLTLRSYGTWDNLKKNINSNLLYTVLSEIKNNTSFLASKNTDLIKERLKEIDKRLKIDLSNLNDLFKPSIVENHYNEINNTKTFLKFKNNIGGNIPHEILKNENSELLKRIERLYPYLEQDILLNDLQSKEYCTGHLRVGCEKNCVQTMSINRIYNLLTTHRGTEYITKDQAYTCQGDIIVSSAKNSLGCWAIVDEDNVGRPVGDGTYILGNTKESIRFWSLLRSKYIQEQIATCADVNINKICYKTLFDNIFINNNIPEYDNINQLSFEVASILNKKTIALNPFPLRYFANKFKELIKLNFSTKHIDFYVLMQKLNVFIRNSSYKPHTECLIVYDNHTLNLLMPRKEDPDNKTYEASRNNMRQKKLAQIFRVPNATQRLCNVNTEKKEQLLKDVSNSDVCIIFLSFDDVKQINLAKKILQIMGKNHIFAELNNANTTIRHEEIPDTLTANFGDVNYCHITEYPGFYMTENIRQLIHHGNYLEIIFKEFLIALSACSRESFKRVECKGKSKATKTYTAKEIFSFETLKKDLIHLAYNLKVTNSFMPYYILLILDNLEKMFMDNPDTKVDDIWKKFRDKYKPLIREIKISRFISKYESLIITNKIALPVLFKIANRDIKDFENKNIFNIITPHGVAIKPLDGKKNIEFEIT